MTGPWLRTTLQKQLLGHSRAMPEVWGRFALDAYSHGKSSWGGRSKYISFNALPHELPRLVRLCGAAVRRLFLAQVLDDTDNPP